MTEMGEDVAREVDRLQRDLDEERKIVESLNAGIIAAAVREARHREVAYQRLLEIRRLQAQAAELAE